MLTITVRFPAFPSRGQTFFFLVSRIAKWLTRTTSVCKRIKLILMLNRTYGNILLKHGEKGRLRELAVRPLRMPRLLLCPQSAGIPKPGVPAVHVFGVPENAENAGTSGGLHVFFRVQGFQHSSTCTPPPPNPPPQQLPHSRVAQGDSMGYDRWGEPPPARESIAAEPRRPLI